jgi:HEAT repeat protein
MAFPRIPRRWRLRTLMIVVALCAAGLVAYREYHDRGLFYQILRLRAGPASARVDAALGLGLMGPRAWLADEALTAALDDPDPNVRHQATYALVRHGSRSPRLLLVLVTGIEHMPVPAPGFSPRSPVEWMFDDPPRGWPLSDGGLYDNDPIEALKLIRPPAALIVPMLGKALKDPNDWVRRAAREALFAVATWSDPSSPELTEALLAVLADYRSDPLHQDIAGYDQFANRKQAVEALAKLDRVAQAKAVAQLAHDLRDLGSPRSYEASWLLPQLANGTDAAVAVLRDQVHDGDEIKRAIALIMLEPIGEPAAPAAPTLISPV